MKKILKNKKWYSIIIIILIIWFMLVLTTWVFNLVLNENKDNRVLWDYIKTYAWAESWQELALLWIKKVWYPYIVNLVKNKDILNKNCWNNCVNLSFKNNWKLDKYSWIILPEESVIVPLFYLDENLKEIKIDNISVSWENIDNLAWNIVSKEWAGLSWTGEIDNNKFWYFTKNQELSIQKKVYNFLNSPNETEFNLLLLNTWNDSVKYNIETNGNFFVSPSLKIVSSWEIKKFKTNIETEVNLVDLNALSKYSIFSP